MYDSAWERMPPVACASTCKGRHRQRQITKRIVHASPMWSALVLQQYGRLMGGTVKLVQGASPMVGVSNSAAQTYKPESSQIIFIVPPPS